MAQIYGMESEDLADDAIHSVIKGQRAKKSMEFVIAQTRIHTLGKSNGKCPVIRVCG